MESRTSINSSGASALPESIPFCFFLPLMVSYRLRHNVSLGGAIADELCVAIVGNVKELGQWAPADGIRLQRVHDTIDLWSGDIVLSVTDDPVQFKYVIICDARPGWAQWETGPNRLYRSSFDVDDDDDDNEDEINTVFRWALDSHTLSFQILDDLDRRYEIDVQLPSLERSAVEMAVRRIAKPFVTGSRRMACSQDYFDSDFDPERTSGFLQDLVRALCTRRYHCANRFEKYYVYAWAIDFVRFEIFSKDYDKELISWSSGEGPIVGEISNPDYNENPVCRLLSVLSP